MNKIVDFDKLLERYFRKWYSENEGKYATPEAMEQDVPKFYEKWGECKLKELDGKTPNGYFAGACAQELLTALQEYLLQNVSVPDVLLTAIAACPGADAEIDKLVRSCENAELLAILMNLMSEINSPLALDFYAELVLDETADETVRELAVEILSDQAGSVREILDRLLSEAPKKNDATRLMIADIVVNDAGNNAVLKLLTELLHTLEDVALCAGYFAKFGDARALPALQQAIEREDLNYAEYLELRNAIEALGGEVEGMRSFENDPYFDALKGITPDSEKLS